MKSNLFLVLLFILVNTIYSQELFIEGSELLQMGDYKGADSVLSLALCSYKNENVYFNRGVARLNLHDTVGFCSDMLIASDRYLDKEAARLYNNTCCKKVDTIYYDRKFNISNSNSFKYYEEIRIPKFDSVPIGLIHDIRMTHKGYSFDFGCEALLGARKTETDIIAKYELIDTVKYFFLSTEPASIKDSQQWEKLKEGAKAIFTAKYSFLKKQNQLDELLIFFELTISPNGDVLGIIFLETDPEIDISKVENDINIDLLTFIKHFPEVIPGKFLSKKVYYKALDYVKF